MKVSSRILENLAKINWPIGTVGTRLACCLLLWSLGEDSFLNRMHVRGNYDILYVTFVVLVIFCSRDAYVAYQRKRIGEVDDDRLKFEVDTMLTREVSV